MFCFRTGLGHNIRNQIRSMIYLIKNYGSYLLDWIQNITEVQELNSNLGWGIFIISPTNILWEILLTLTFVKLQDIHSVHFIISQAVVSV